MPVSVNIISPSMGFGHQADIQLVASLLEKHDFEVSITPFPDVGRGRLKVVAKQMLKRRRRFDINIFMSYLFPESLPLARKNIFIPNVEDMPDHTKKYLRHVDLFVAKTRLTEQAYRDAGYPTAYSGFTARDLYDPAVPRDFTRFFHSCSSQFKGTKALVELWARHPEWPELVATINHNPHVPEKLAPNVRALRGPMSAADASRIRNAHGFHICTSEAEGYGHYIAEPMSCKAVVFATDGAPMNELIRPGRGFLIETLEEKRTPRGFSHLHFFKPESLEQHVENALKLDRATIDRIGKNARAFFLEGRQKFLELFPKVIRTMAP